jgi:hypothetical protein
MKMIGETREDWLCFLHGDDSRTFLVLVSEEEARGAYALYREGRVLEAAQALDEAVAVAYEVPEELWDDLVDTVPDMAWRAKGFPLVRSRSLTSGPGRPSSSSGVSPTRRRRCRWGSSPASAGTVGAHGSFTTPWSWTRSFWRRSPWRDFPSARNPLSEG